MTRKVSVLVVLIVLVFLAGCASQEFVKNTYRALALQGQAYDAAMSAAGDLYRDGKIDDSEKEKIVTAARAYKGAYDRAVEKMIEYEKAPPAEKDAAVRQAEIAAEILSRLFGDLSDILGAFGIKLLPE